MRAVLDGERTAFRDIVVLNSAAALWVAGRAADIAAGARIAADSIDRGSAKVALARLLEICDQGGGATRSQD
jgi:anthranilate phosphoribosyltransferase